MGGGIFKEDLETGRMVRKMEGGGDIIRKKGESREVEDYRRVDAHSV